MQGWPAFAASALEFTIRFLQFERDEFVPREFSSSSVTFSRDEFVLREFLVIGPCSSVLGPWSLVIGPWSLVLGPWSLVLGSWSLGPWSCVDFFFHDKGPYK